MPARVCKECNSAHGAVGCDHWELWPENIHQPHDWIEQLDKDLKVRCRACGLVATVADLASGKVDALHCPQYVLVRPDGAQAPD